MTEPGTAIAIAMAKPLVTKLCDALLRPIAAAVQGVADPVVDIFGDRFSEYLTRQLVKHSYLPTIVFQIRQPLEEIYVPLTVAAEGSLGHREKRFEIRLDKYVKSFIPELERVLVIDSAGMGKTTLSRFLFVQAIRTLTTVPIFIELRHLTGEKTILDHLQNELNPAGSDTQDLKIDKRQIIRLLEKGVFTFFLDGYDEISNTNRERVTRDIKKITETFSSNKFLITSRPEHALASFPSFHAFRIKSLKKDEAFDLIRKYDKGGEKGEKLISKLSDRSLPEVSEFLENPLLTTLLYRAYDYKAQIPLKKPNFYRQVFDALFEWHDLTKDGYSTRDKTSKLDIDGFHKILRGLGFISIMKGRIEADTDEMLNWVREAKTYAPDLKFAESDFLEDAIKAVPILRREGNSILWSHKSLAEYFCAQFIVSDAKADQSKICEHIANTINIASYHNLLDLLYDMDIVLFSTHFIKPLINFYQLELRRLSEIFPDTPLPQVELRAAATFGMRPFILSDTTKEISASVSVKIAAISEAAMSEWYGVDALFENSDLLDGRLKFGGGGYGKNRVLTLSHPLRTIFEILAIKKHPLILLRALYPQSLEKGNILGTRDKQGFPINETPSATWNNQKNFSNTTSALALITAGIINTSRINSVLREIEQISGKSQTTAPLLRALDKST